MLLKVAWRNIWRNRTRSLVVITTIALGLWAGMFASAFVYGMLQQKVESVISLEISHVQIHHPKFRDEIKVNQVVDEAGWRSELAADDQIKHTSERVVVMAMMASPTQSGAVRVSGIKPQDEMQVSDLHRFVNEGGYLGGDKGHTILISRKMAEKYKVKMRSKLVLTLQDIQGEITAAAFRVSGIYDSGNGLFDEANAYVHQKDLQKLTGIGDGVHEIAILSQSHDLADSIASRYQSSYPNLEVKSWLDLSSGIRFMIEAMDVYTLFIVGIILVALLFSIINTMLMAVLERIREIGMLMAVGMSKGRVFFMIILETFLLNMVGGPIGLLLAGWSIHYFGERGINLGDGAAYADFGFSNVIYPELELQSYVQVSLMVFVMALVAAIYPARKALKLKPVEAIRKI